MRLKKLTCCCLSNVIMLNLYIPYIQIYLFDEELGKQFGIFIDKSLLASLSINKLEFDLRKEILNRYDERERTEISI